MKKRVQSNIRRKGSSSKQKKSKKTTKRRNAGASKKSKYTIVRVMGHGQFRVGNRTAKKISRIDNELIKIIELRKEGDKTSSRRVLDVLGLVKKDGVPLEHKEIIQSDIIVPGADISIEEAKNLFTDQHLLK
jgi:PspA-Associated protein